MAKFCTNCGASMPNDKNFCTECGMSVNTENSNVATDTSSAAPPPIQQTPPPVRQASSGYQAPPPAQQAAPAQQPVYQYTPVNAGETVTPKDSKYDPITTKGYIGIMLLMCIPVVGIVLTIIWACGGCKKINKRNLARASLIMMAVGFVISLILGFVIKAVFKKAVEAAGVDVAAIESLMDDSKEEGNSSNTSGVLGLLGAIAGEGNDSNSNVTNSDIEELQELGNILESLEALSGENSDGSTSEEGGSWDELIDGVVAINQEAEAANDGWPSSLRKYPGGTAKATASYRTEISDTTLEEMMTWIEDLRGDGYEFQDFYNFGMTEQDMLDMNGWWATDGKIYLSVSYYEGVVTIDHTKELPDLGGLFE